MDSKQYRINTVKLVIAVILLIILCILFEGVLKEIIVDRITPDIQNQINLEHNLSNDSEKDITSNGNVGGPEAFIEPFAISSAIIIEIIITLIISNGLLYHYYKREQSIFSLKCLKGLLNISKVIFLLGIVFSTIYITFAQSYDFLNFFYEKEEHNFLRNIILELLYTKKDNIYAFTTISGVFWIPFEYCIEKENAILQKEKGTERNKQIENRIEEQENRIKKTINGQVNPIKNIIKKQEDSVKDLNSKIIKIEKRIKEQENMIIKLKSEINENKGTISDDRNHGCVNRKTNKRKNVRKK